MSEGKQVHDAWAGMGGERSDGEWRVVITDSNFGSDDIEREELGEGVHLVKASAHTAEEVIAAGEGAVGLLVQWAPITRRVLEALPTVRYVVRYGVGLDNIDLVAARDLGVAVLNVDDYCIDEVASHATAMIEARARRLFAYDGQVKGGGWSPDDVESPVPAPREAVGIAGLGRIGRAVAARIVALGHPVFYWDPYLAESSEGVIDDRIARVDTLLTLAENVRHLSLHVPATAETIGMVTTPVLDALGDDGHVVNTARGSLVDEPALLRWLERGRAWASLDVLGNEPPDGTSRALAMHARVTVTPHVAYRSTGSPAVLRLRAATLMARLLSTASLEIRAE